MAALAVGGLFASSTLFKYNRKNFMFDKKLRQEREFQEQDMRVEQFVLYREDVRDLVELTVSKMDLYMIAAALLADRLTVMICTQNEAFPEQSPGWLVALMSMSLASGMFYLLLCLYLAQYASVSAQAYGTRLLTQLVRLPYATRQQITNATSQGTDFEERAVGEMLRVPIAQRDGPGTRDPGADDVPGPQGTGARAAAADEGSGQRDDPTDTRMTNLLPTAMLEHIRLYRRMQLNWLAYDAYARVSLFAGTSSILYCCLYRSLGQFLHNEHALLPAFSVSLVFACLQVCLLRLDLRLTRLDLTALAILLFSMPAFTSVGMIVHEDLRQNPPATKWKFAIPLVSLCAFGSHLLHTLVVALLLAASWPDTGGGADAFLPGKFRSTLFLDVFGWLLNPGGPGQADEQEDPVSGAVPTSPLLSSALRRRSPSREAPMPDGRQRASSAGGRLRAFSAGRQRAASAPLSWPAAGLDSRDRGSVRDIARVVDISPELRRDTARLMSPRPRPRSQELRFGGREAQPVEVMRLVNEPSVDNTTDFTTMPAARRLPVKALPGERPWRSFRTGTQVILALWMLCTLWTFGTLITGGWDRHGPEPEVAAPSLVAEAAVGPVLTAACSSFVQPSALRPPLGMSQRTRRRLTTGPACRELQQLHARRRACLSTGSVDLTCLDPSKPCLQGLLHRGGREVTVCSAKRGRAGLWPLLTLHLVEGLPSLRHVVPVWSGKRWPSGLLLLGRDVEGALLAMSAQLHSSRSKRGRLVPEFDLELPGDRLFGRNTGESLAAVGEMLISLQSGGLQADSCNASAQQDEPRPPSLTVWDLSRGGREERWLDERNPACEEPLLALHRLCRAQGHALGEWQ